MMPKAKEVQDFTKMRTVKEVSELLRVCPKSIHRYKDKCCMPYDRFGGTIRFEKDRVMDWARRNYPLRAS